MKHSQELRIVPHGRSKLVPIKTSTRKDTMICATTEGLYRIRISSIRYLEAQGNYARIHFGVDKSILVSKTVAVIQALIPPKTLIRVHQSYAVHGSQISSFTNGVIALRDGSEIPVSRARKSEVRQWILNSGIRLS